MNDNTFSSENVNADTVSSTITPISVSEIAKSSWNMVPGFKGTYMASLASMLAFVLVPSVILILLLPTESYLSSLCSLVIQAFALTLNIGFMMLGVRRARGEEVNFKMIFNYMPDVLKLFAVNLLMGVLILLGFCLLILPGIYLAISYVFVNPLIVDKKLDFWQAMEASRAAVSKQWFSYFFLFIVMLLLNFVGAIPLGIGLIWTLPFTLIMYGRAYRNTVFEI